MRRQTTKLGKILIISAKFGYFVLGVFLIFALAYLLGYKFLGYKILIAEPTIRWVEGRLLGNDSSNALTFISWLNHYFPKIPVWYPFQGGGVSFTQGYSILAHFLVVLLHRISSLTLIQAFRLLGFLSIPLTALAIYLFCWTRLKNQTIGLIGAIFYLLTPLSWSWLYDWGFFSYNLSFPFFVFTFIFFDFYFSSLKSKNEHSRFWFFLTILGFGVTTLTHVATGMGLVTLMALYVFLSSLSLPFFSRLKKGILALLTVGGVGFALLLFWLAPFYRYMTLANREGFLNLDPSLGPPIFWQGFLSLTKITLDPAYAAYRNISIPILIWGLSILGILLAFRYSRKIPALGIISWLGIINVGFLLPLTFLAKISPSLAQFFSIRVFLPTTAIFLPIVAAFALWAIFKSAFFFLKQEKLRSFLICSLSFILMVFLVGFFRNVSSDDEFYLNYGPDPVHFDIRDIWDKRADDPCLIEDTDFSKPKLCQIKKAREKLNITEFLSQCAQFKGEKILKPELCRTEEPTPTMVEAFVLGCQRHEEEDYFCQGIVEGVAEQLRLENWPKIFISKGGISMTSLTGSDGLLAGLLLDESTRVDVSPRLGWIIQGLNFHRNIPQLAVYTNQLSLIHGMWGQQQEVFYTQEGIEPEEVSELAKWFGINYIFLDLKNDPLGRYPSDLWEEVAKRGDLAFLRFKEGEKLASLSDKPLILVIGSFKRGAYTQIFRLGNKGALPYEQFFLVEGKEKIDDYSLEELKEFDIVFLHGYSYKNQSRAWERLDKYVKEGGAIFVDTGWQYAAADWETKSAPEVLPIKVLEWTNFGKTKDFRLENKEIGGEVEVGKFAPLVWGDVPWGVSAPVGDLRDWARPVLTVKGRSLIVAGQYGQGRVVWSGMNLVAHAQDKENKEEVKFLNSLINWLGEGKERKDLEVLVKRDYPDKVEFILTESIPAGTSLYWREAFYPDWKAVITEGTEKKLKIYRGGPGLMLMRLPPLPAGAKVILRLRQPWFIYAAKAISLLTLIFLIGFVLEGLFWKGRLTARLATTFRIGLKKRLVKPLINFWEKDEEV